MTAREAHGNERLRVVLIEPDRVAAVRLGNELLARGIALDPFLDAHAGLRALRRRGADVVLLATPLGDADWIAAVAAVKEGPEPPLLVLLDGTGQGGALAAILPAERLPDAVVAKPVSAAKLLLELAEAQRFGPASARGATPGPTFPELLMALQERGETGALELRADGVCTRLLLRDGMPVFAEGGVMRETLGRMLLRRGALSEVDYVRVIERMTERIIENEAARMGEVLVELGLLTPDEVLAALSAQLQEKVVGCFRWPRFEHGFEPLDALPGGVLACACPAIEALVLAGLREHFDCDRLEPLLSPHAERHPRLRGRAETIAERFRMAPAEQRLLAGLGGQRTLAAVRAGSPLDPVHTAQLLAALEIGRALAWSEEAARESATVPRLGAAPSPPQPAPATPKPAPAARPAAVAHATARPTLAPLRASDPARSLSALRSQLARSGRPMPEPPPDPRTARLDAERAFRQGVHFLEQAALPGALRAFQRACELNGDEPEYRMWEAWAEYLSVKDDEARGLARAKATACAQRMLSRDRDSVRAHAILGQLAANGGDLEGAGRHFRAILRIAPEDRDAQRGLRLVERRRAGK